MDFFTEAEVQKLRDGHFEYTLLPVIFTGAHYIAAALPRSPRASWCVVFCESAQKSANWAAVAILGADRLTDKRPPRGGELAGIVLYFTPVRPNDARMSSMSKTVTVHPSCLYFAGRFFAVLAMQPSTGDHRQ